MADFVDTLFAPSGSRNGSPALLNTQPENYVTHDGRLHSFDKEDEYLSSSSDTTVEDTPGEYLPGVMSQDVPNVNPTMLDPLDPSNQFPYDDGFLSSFDEEVEDEGYSLNEGVTNFASLSTPSTATFHGSTHCSLDDVCDDRVSPNTSGEFSIAMQKDQSEASVLEGVSDARIGNKTLSSKNRKHQCDFQGCGATFAKESRLKEHCKTTHGDDFKPIACLNKSKGCTVRFTDSANMRKHLLTSCQETPEEERETHMFKCTEPGCTKMFGRKTSLDDHRYTCHTKQGREGQKRHKCKKCAGGFGSASGLGRHVRTVHGDGNTVRNGRGTKRRGTKRRKEPLCQSLPTKKWKC